MLTDKQNKELNKPLLREHVSTREGGGNTTLSYLAGHHVINQANAIFGFEGYDDEILILKEVDRTIYDKKPYNAGDEPIKMVSISYLCTLRVTVKDDKGNAIAVKEDTGFGNGTGKHDGTSAFGITSAIELASKEAVTDAFKRCMRFFGNQFGLVLYDKAASPLLSMSEADAITPVTDVQLDLLRGLYEERDIDDKWVLAALKAENWDGNDLTQLRNDWYVLIFDITKKYKLDIISKAHYEEDIGRVMALMKDSANIRMLKALFGEAWTKTTNHEDKARQAECQKIYEEMKAEFEK